MPMTVERAPAPVATWIGLALALLGIPLLSRAVPRHLAPVAATMIVEAMCCALTAAVLVILVRWERRPLRSIGLKPPGWRTFLLGVAVFFVLSAVYGAGTAVQRGFGLAGSEVGLARLLVLPLWLRVLMVVRAGVVEEILYRGYPIERLTWLTGSGWAGALVPLIVFSLAHAPFWGAAYLIVVVPAAAVQTAVYLWKRDLGVNIVAHFLSDCVGIVIVPLLTRDPG